MFSFIKRKDPICEMKEEKGKGMQKHRKWFCSEQCLKKYEDEQMQKSKQTQHKDCC